MKKIGILLIIFILGSLPFLGGCIDSGNGTLTLQITDAPGDLNITEALVTISGIEVHLAAGGNNNTTAEWKMVVEESQTFDLVGIRNVKELLGSKNLSAGVYTQIRLHIDEALVTINGSQYDLQIPSESIKLVKGFRIIDGETTTLTLDFDVNESVHKTGSDKYIFQPTIIVIQE
ncbi:DUF4382 domain-containing protein [Thermoplasmatota archaeon]